MSGNETHHEGVLADSAVLMRCTKCGTEYPIMPYFKAAAEHGPDRSCDGREWVPVEEKRNAS